MWRMRCMLYSRWPRYVLRVFNLFTKYTQCLRIYKHKSGSQSEVLPFNCDKTNQIVQLRLKCVIDFPHWPRAFVYKTNRKERRRILNTIGELLMVLQSQTDWQCSVSVSVCGHWPRPRPVHGCWCTAECCTLPSLATLCPPARFIPSCRSLARVSCLVC